MEVAGPDYSATAFNLNALAPHVSLRARSVRVFATANGSIRVSGMEDINSILREPCGRVCILMQRELDARVSPLKRLNRASDVPDGIM